MTNHPVSPIAVIKVGGDVLLTENGGAGLAGNVSDLIRAGWWVVVLHGGGPQINRLQQSLGLKPRKVGGRRITGPEDLQVVIQAVCGEANVHLTTALLAVGINAFGTHGASGRLIQSVKRAPRIVSGSGGDPIDFGNVGDVTGINTMLLGDLLRLGLVPVIATLGVAPDGTVYNINADTTVAAMAQALHAKLLILTTSIGGIFKDPEDASSRISTIRVNEVDSLIQKGIVSDGMIPKLEEAASLINRGVERVAVVGPTIMGAFAAIAGGSDGFGTIICR